MCKKIWLLILKRDQVWTCLQKNFAHTYLCTLAIFSIFSLPSPSYPIPNCLLFISAWKHCFNFPSESIDRPIKLRVAKVFPLMQLLLHNEKAKQNFGGYISRKTLGFWHLRFKHLGWMVKSIRPSNRCWFVCLFVHTHKCIWINY